MNARAIVFSLAVFVIAPLSHAQDEGLKIYISADMEGVVGAVTGDQLSPGGFEYQRFREFMTAEVNAAIDAARAAGATEFVVSDSHGNGENLLIEKLPDDVTIIRSWPRELSMMAGIDDTFDGVIFLGYHASTANTRGVRAHTMSSANITSLRLNGIEMTEGSMAAAAAGHFGVPVIMVSGDDVAVAENQVLIGNIEGAVVKWAKGFHSAETLTPEAGYEVIRTRTKSAIDRISTFEPYVLETPIELELTLKHYQPVELLGYLKNVERINSHTIRYVGEDIIEISNFLTFVTNFRVDLEPEKMRKIYFVLALTTFFGCSEQSPGPSGTAITNVTVIDAVNGVRENQSVVFNGDEITAIQSADAELNAAEVIDGSGKFLIPGLWDFHVHLTYDDRFNDSMSALFLAYGITSVRDTGGLMRKMLPVVEKMRAEDAIAPRVFFAGPLLDGNFVVYDGDSRPEIGTRNATPEQAKATIADLKSQGVDFIKIYEMVSPAVFDAMVEAANEHALPIDSHVPLSMRANTAGPRVDSIEHLRNIELDCAANAPELHETRLELLKNEAGMSGFELRSSLHSLQRNPAIENYDEARCDQTIAALGATTMVPTLRLNSFSLAPPYLRNDWEDALARIPQAVREDWAATGERMAADPSEDIDLSADFSVFLVNRMHAAGVPIGAGTDTPIFLSIPGYSLHSELEMLVKAGLTPLQAIQSATVRPAEYFSLQDKMGSIDVGKKADMVLLDANPMDEITNTKRISGVVSKGDFMDSDELGALVQSSHETPK